MSEVIVTQSVRLSSSTVLEYSSYCTYSCNNKISERLGSWSTQKEYGYGVAGGAGGGGNHIYYIVLSLCA